MEPAATALVKWTRWIGAILIAGLLAGGCQRAAEPQAGTPAPSVAGRSEVPIAPQTSPNAPAAAAVRAVDRSGDTQGKALFAQPEALERKVALAPAQPRRTLSESESPAESRHPEPGREPAQQAGPPPQSGAAAQAEEAPAPQAQAQEAPAPQAEPPLPPPLVDHPETLQRLHPNYPVWIDADRNHVVMVGRVCQRRAPLELFACLSHSKEHESVVAVDTKAYVVHAGLLALGAEPGQPVRFVPDFQPPSGTQIEVTVVWEDELGRRRQARAQDWVRDVAELYSVFQGLVANQFDEELDLADQPTAWQEMSYPWVFAGSQFLEDERTGQRFYQADGEGDLICVSNFPSAVLDVPVQSSASNAALMFEAFTERIPPLGTPVTLLLSVSPQATADEGEAGR